MSALVLSASVLLDPGVAHALPSASAGAGDIPGAFETAAESGQPQPIPSLTDAYSTTVAEPDGTLGKSLSPIPVRVESANGWIPLDPSLRANADGSLTTAATTSPLTLSGGGNGPLATLTSAGSTMSLSWPSTLPAPAVDGPSATYADVLPGVDLRVTADEQGGISEVLIVSDAAAAADPGLDQLALTVHTTNATLHADSADNVTATDAGGHTVFHAPTPIMWDSGDDQDAAVDPASAPPDSAAISPIDVSLSSGHLSLTPDQSMLDDPTTQFPVYIDPSFLPVTKDQSGWAWAQQANPDTSWYNSNSNGNPAVGYQGWDGGYQGMNRAFYQFTTGLGSAHVQSATLQLTEVDTGLYDCSASYSIAVYNSGNISDSTTWNHQPSLGALLDTTAVTGADPGHCGQKTFQWSVTSNVAGNTDGSVTYRVQAPSGHEDERNYYRRFGSNGKTGATLFIKYNWVPNTPTNLSMSPAPQNPSSMCDSSNIGWIPAQASGTITLAAQVSDRDQAGTSEAAAQPVGADFQLVDRGTTGDGTASVIAMGAAAGQTGTTTTTNGTVRKAISTSLLVNGHSYSYRAEGDDGIDTSPVSGWCWFAYDTGQPTIATPTSTAFKNDGTGTATVGMTGTFAISATDPAPSNGGIYSKIHRICYSFASSTEATACDSTYKTVTPSGSVATTSLNYTPTTWGTQNLWVVAKDNAGNASTTATYQFYVADNGTISVHPGDVDGDSRPDFLGVVGSELKLFRTAASGSTHLPTAVLASSASESPAVGPDGKGSWAGALLAHRASESGKIVDDLWALQGETLLLYTNNINADGGVTANRNLYYTLDHAITVLQPESAPSAYVKRWSDVTSMISLGDVTGDGKSDLIMIKVDNGTGTAWFMPSNGATGQFGTPQQVGFNNWQNYDLISPGDASGDGLPDVWVRDKRSAASGGTDQLEQFTLVKNGSTFSFTGYAIEPHAAFGPDSSRRIVASPGDTDGDGLPELYTVSTSGSSHGQIWENEATKQSPTTLDIGPHSVIDDGASTDWSTVSVLS